MKYTAAQSRIVNLIAQEKLAEGDRLPNEIELSSLCGVSTITTRRALKELGELGIIERRQGSGTFVKQSPAAGPRMGTVHLLVVGSNPVLYEHMLGSAQRALLERGYGLRHLATTVRDDATIAELADADAVLVTGSIDSEWVQLLRALSKPFVVVGGCEAPEPVWQVDYDWARAVELLVRALLSRGCREIGFLNAARRYAPARQGYAAYCRVLKEAGLPVVENRIAWCRRDEYAQRIREFFDRNTEPLDGLIVEQNVFPHLLLSRYDAEASAARPVLAVCSSRPLLQTTYHRVIEAAFSEDLTRRGVDLLFDVMGARWDEGRTILLRPEIISAEPLVSAQGE